LWRTWLRARHALDLHARVDLSLNAAGCWSGIRPGEAEENGASLNCAHRASAHRLARSLAARPGPQIQSQSQIRPRAGAVQAAVIQALAEADRPLRAREIHQAAQKLAKMPLSWSTVKDCLHTNARRPNSPIERVSHGHYRHR
jgi:hypothetical protein